MNQKEKQITIKLNLKINLSNYKFELGNKKNWVIPLLVIGLKIVALYLKIRAS
jgi:hypothetical protein